MELYQGRVRLRIRKGLFTERMAGHWSRLPRAAVMASVLDNPPRLGFEFGVVLYGARNWTQ